MAGNGRVTTAELGRKLDYITGRLDRFCDEMEPRVRELENTQGIQDEKIDQLRTQSKLWLSVNTALIAIGTAIGINK